MWKITIQYTVQGFEPLTFRTWVSPEPLDQGLSQVQDEYGVFYLMQKYSLVHLNFDEVLTEVPTSTGRFCL